MPNCFRIDALHLGDADAQHHLLLAFDDEQVDDRLGGVDVVAAAGRRTAVFDALFD